MQTIATYQRRTFLKDHPPILRRVLLGSSGAAQTLLAGSVLGLKAADSKIYLYTADTTGEAPNQVAVYDADCILAEDVTVPAAGDIYALAYTHAAVIDSQLVWEDDVTAEQQKAALAVLRTKGIHASEA